MRVIRAHDVASLRAGLQKAKESDETVLVHIETDPLVDAPDSESWWDVPVSEVAGLDTTRDARATYEKQKRAQRPLIGPRSASSGDLST